MSTLIIHAVPMVGSGATSMNTVANIKFDMEEINGFVCDATRSFISVFSIIDKKQHTLKD